MTLTFRNATLSSDWRELTAYDVYVDGILVGTVRSHTTSTSRPLWTAHTPDGQILPGPWETRQQATQAFTACACCSHPGQPDDPYRDDCDCHYT